MTTTSVGADLIAAERQRQIDVEGYTLDHDRAHDGPLALAAACYALPQGYRQTVWADDEYTVVPSLWPWRSEYWKPTPDDRVRELVKAGALIAAEIDRLHADRG